MNNYEVFISHSHKDKAVADAICHYFEDEKIKCWIAPRDITPGTNWADAISDAIPACKIFLLIFSAHANLSPQVFREVELAVKNKLTIVPVRIEDTSPTRGMEYYLSAVHWIDVVNKKTEKYITTLAETVKGFLEAKEKMPVPLGNSGISKKKRNPLAVWLPAAAVVILLAVLGFVFRDSLFGNANESLDASANQPTEIIDITAEPTLSPTTAPTAEPTATIEPNVSLDKIVDIPNLTLKSCILKTLSDAGTPVEGNLTVGDMHKLTQLVIVSKEEYYSDEDYYIEYKGLIGSSQIESLEGLQYAKNLETLIIIDLRLKDISALSQIYNLKHVRFSINRIEDISALSSHGNLANLEVSGNYITNINPLVLCYSLDTLDISGNNISNLSPLKGMFALKNLDVQNTSIKNLEPISELTNLEFINASNNDFSAANSLDSLNNFYNLDLLILNNCGINKININPLDNLTRLSLTDNNIDDINFLLNFKILEELYIDSDVCDANAEVINELLSRGCKIENVW